MCVCVCVLYIYIYGRNCDLMIGSIHYQHYYSFKSYASDYDKVCLE